MDGCIWEGQSNPDNREVVARDDDARHRSLNVILGAGDKKDTLK